MIGKLARQLMRILPDALSYRLMLSQIGKTEHVAALPIEQEAIARGKPFKYGADGKSAFEWGSGPLLILVHGWNGSAAQIAPLAVALADKGYRCVAFDITGNGGDGTYFTRWSYFLRDIDTLTRSLQSEVFAYIGHSSGGTTMMAARRGGRIDAERYVCICSPSYPFLSVDHAAQAFEPNERIMQRYKQYLAGDFGIPWAELEAGGSFEGMRDNLLLVYDERDRMVPHSQGDLIRARCSGSRLVKTNKYGHKRILTAPELPRAIIDFLAGTS
jgi:pimeloyl-ACP methyl ester carboxylesterase